MRDDDCLYSILVAGSPAGDTTNITSVFGRNVSGFSMTLDRSNLKVDQAHPGSFWGPSDDDVFVKYPTDSGGPFGNGGSAIGTSHHTHLTGVSGLPCYYLPAVARDGATRSQVPPTEDFQAHTETKNFNFPQSFHYHAISSSQPFRNISFEVYMYTGGR